MGKLTTYSCEVVASKGSSSFVLLKNQLDLDCHPEQSEGSRKYAARAYFIGILLPPRLDQNDNGHYSLPVLLFSLYTKFRHYSSSCPVLFCHEFYKYYNTS